MYSIYREHQDIAASWSRIVATVKGLMLFAQVLWEKCNDR